MAKVIPFPNQSDDRLAQAFMMAMIRQGITPKGGCQAFLKRLQEK